MTLFAALSAGAKTYLLCNFSIFLFSAFTERLGVKQKELKHRHVRNVLDLLHNYLGPTKECYEVASQVRSKGGRSPD